MIEKGGQSMSFDVMEKTPAWEIGLFILSHFKQSVPVGIELAKISLAIALQNKERSLARDFEKVSRWFSTDIRLEGTEHIPQGKDGFIFVLSHTVSTLKFPCWYDTSAHPIGFVKGLYDALKPLHREEDLRLVVRDDVESPTYRMKQKIYRSYNAYTVTQGNGAALRHAITDLTEGKIVMIALEGQSSTELLPFNNGVGLLSLAKKLFVPAAYFEVRDNNRSHFILRFGPSIPAETVRNTGVDVLGHAVAALLPKEKRGYYML